MQQKPHEDTYTYKQTTRHTNNKKLDLEQSEQLN